MLQQINIQSRCQTDQVHTPEHRARIIHRVRSDSAVFESDREADIIEGWKHESRAQLFAADPTARSFRQNIDGACVQEAADQACERFGTVLETTELGNGQDIIDERGACIRNGQSAPASDPELFVRGRRLQAGFPE